MQTRSERPFWRSRWWMPLFSLALGAVMLVAFAIGDDVEQGVISFGVMAAVAALFLFGGRSETLRGIGGPGRDERWAAIDMRASVFAGLVLICAIIGAWLWEVAHGDDGEPLHAARSARRGRLHRRRSPSCAGARSYFAKSVARDSRITVTLIWPGYSSSCSISRAISCESSTAPSSSSALGWTITRISRPACIA